MYIGVWVGVFTENNWRGFSLDVGVSVLIDVEAIVGCTLAILRSASLAFSVVCCSVSLGTCT